MANTEKLELLRRRKPSEIIGDAFTFIRVNLAILLKVHFLVSLPMILVIAAGFLLLFRDQFSLLTTIQSGPFVDAIAVRDSASRYMVSVMFSMLATMPISINTYAIVDVYSRKEDGAVTFEEVWGVLKKKFLPLLGLKVVTAIMIFSAGLFLFIPGLIIYSFLVCAELLIIQHGYGVFKAIGRSFSTMYKVFWDHIWLNILFLAVFVMFGFLMGLPVTLLESMAGFTTGTIDIDSPWTIMAMALRTFNTILSYVIYTIPTVVMAIQYFTIREKLSKASIVERINKIGLEKSKINEYALGDEQY